MEYRPFGQTGLEVSAIGFGCWELGGSYGHFDEGEVIAADRGKAMYHLALRWVLSNPVVSVALVGARTPEEVEANMGALDWTLTDADHQAIDAVFEK